MSQYARKRSKQRKRLVTQQKSKDQKPEDLNVQKMIEERDYTGAIAYLEVTTV